MIGPARQVCWKVPNKLRLDCYICAVASCLEKAAVTPSPSRVQLLHNDLSEARGDLTALAASWKLLSLARLLHCQEAPVHQSMLSLHRVLLKVQIVGSCRGAEPLRVQ